MADFGLLKDGRIIDLRPMDKGEGVDVWDGKAWVPFEGKMGSVTDSKPLTEEEANALLSTVNQNN